MPFVQQHKVGKYRLDFAVLETRTAIEIDGPHHLRPDVAHKDAIRDTELRAGGWLILRVTAGQTIDEEQLLRAALVARDGPSPPMMLQKYKSAANSQVSG